MACSGAEGEAAEAQVGKLSDTMQQRSTEWVKPWVANCRIFALIQRVVIRHSSGSALLLSLDTGPRPWSCLGSDALGAAIRR